MLVFKIVTISSLSLLSTLKKSVPSQRYPITQNYKKRGDRILPEVLMYLLFHFLNMLLEFTQWDFKYKFHKRTG